MSFWLQVWRNGLPLERGCLKINCNAAMKKDDSAASIAVICLRFESLCLAKAMNLSSIEIQGDNKQAISLCVSEDHPPRECSTSLINVDLMASEFSFFLLVF
ncbi:hypothetical protein RHGRI_007340 [Rhododendron griersonianum]|uniref:RNase H type-1 domain-containing protein n=1 Tax=Rhododendron griersonianum TaxID=479676 RepID=A0AAV6KY73_9ERIC|nr:hypothetical protein RHGRI_007340 [Rhododendron griersonianum]